MDWWIGDYVYEMLVTLGQLALTPTTNMNRTKKSATAPKKKSSTHAGEAVGESAMLVKCAVCEQTIVEGKEQALYCKGTCKQWFHRYCAGIPSCWFATLSASSSPFKCYACCQAEPCTCCQAEPCTLRDIVATLKEEVSVLKSDIKAVSLANVSTRVRSIPEDVGANYVGVVVAGGVARGAGQRRVGHGGMWKGTIARR